MPGTDVTAGGATGGQASMTHDEVSAVAQLPARLDGFMAEMRQQFATLGDKILPAINEMTAEIGRLQKTVDRVNRENREHRKELDELKAQVRDLQLERAAANTDKATRRPSPRKKRS